MTQTTMSIPLSPRDAACYLHAARWLVGHGYDAGQRFRATMRGARLAMAAGQLFCGGGGPGQSGSDEEDDDVLGKE